MDKGIKIFQYNNYPVTFNMGEFTMINATEMAKLFSNAKRPQFWLNNQQTKEFLNALTKARNLASADLVKVIKKVATINRVHGCTKMWLWNLPVG